MCEEMGLAHLQQTLRRLCFKSEWKYAVFWKLKYRAHMMLSLEDAYYANHDSDDRSDNILINGGYDNLHDPLGLAVAKMSYFVYPLGEGIIGEVAVTGKHQWIFADKPTSHSWSSSEYWGGWQAQFSAGIKTIVVVAVVPHGVVQLGSLQTVTEDLKPVTQIKDVFYSLQISSLKCLPSPNCYVAQSSSCLSEVSATVSGSEVFGDVPQHSNIVAITHGKTDNQSYSLPFAGIFSDVAQHVLAIPDAHHKKTGEVIDEDVGVKSTIMRDREVTDYVNKHSLLLSLEQHKPIQKELNNRVKHEEAHSEMWSIFAHSRHTDNSSPCNYFSENSMCDSFMLPLDEFVNYPFSRILQSGVEDEIKFDRVVYLPNEELRVLEPLEVQTTQSEVSCTDTICSSLRLSSGCELHEALGPAFRKQQESCSWSESERKEAEVLEPVGRTGSSSSFRTDCGLDDLLEAVVANSCTLSSNTKHDDSLCKSAESLLTTGKPPETPSHVKHGSLLSRGSVAHSSPSVEDGHKNLKLIWGSTEVCNTRSSKDSLSQSLTTSGKLSDMPTEPAKISRKRARPGESCRPRPRDRQLIQDRVKELRELVPDSSKCSIDSLLERTIKHMFFLQSVTKHVDKLWKCSESKICDNKISLLGSCSNEHGSSWALDVGGQADVCPLVVENLNLDGQMLVEMLCEECSRFLDIAEAIRSLGLTILKGVTEGRGESIWACFVVEGQNSRGMHRMDVLWSLMQLLQPKATM